MDNILVLLAIHVIFKYFTRIRETLFFNCVRPKQKAIIPLHLSFTLFQQISYLCLRYLYIHKAFKIILIEIEQTINVFKLRCENNSFNAFS